MVITRTSTISCVHTPCWTRRRRKEELFFFCWTNFFADWIFVLKRTTMKTIILFAFLSTAYGMLLVFFIFFLSFYFFIVVCFIVLFVSLIRFFRNPNCESYYSESFENYKKERNDIKPVLSIMKILTIFFFFSIWTNDCPLDYQDNHTTNRL